MAAREEELTLQCECASRSGRAQRKSGGQRRERSREARPLDILADARKTWRSVDSGLYRRLLERSNSGAAHFLRENGAWTAAAGQLLKRARHMWSGALTGDVVQQPIVLFLHRRIALAGVLL